ncbi:DUF971 domain-containing protein [Candidatus Methylacidithermus pantelleriae]|uniref:GBBH-like_N domain-containing protein n=1 Tax=Candidatus Methylacidithermus pantelleriae TaxID=2744239 RepID=A0A8J2FRA8_9BACT|nr:DUF971 domain-containing protein [Candidatus Methylacidithermus pantelleriae]CAF0689450.1 GBBH-like_N domain-containing protein [Candidatus Methylacidithermus pantelleriae]
MAQPSYPRLIEQVGQELAIAWSDGTESFLPLERLRKACPCALCQGEPDVTGQRVTASMQKYSPRSFQLVGWRLVGSYALQLRWADGHDTGLYPFSYLKDLGREGGFREPS